MNHRITSDDRESPITFVDTHCHLDDESFSADLPEVLERCRSLGVTRWINVGFNPERWDSAIHLSEQIAGMSCMLGMHPGDANRWNDTVCRALQEKIRRHRPVAIGEIGLDFFRGETNVEIQKDAFNTQLDLAIEADLPVAIHMREAEPQMLEVLERRSELPVILFHSYDGTEALTNWVIASGSYVGVGGLATRTKSDALREQLMRISPDRLVLETDSPYLVPNGFKHRRNTPESIPRIAAALARMLEVPVAEIAARTTGNAQRLFERLPSA